MRSFPEIQFRLTQEIANAYLYRFSPKLAARYRLSSVRVLPDPASFVPRLKGSPMAKAIEQIAESISRHRFPVLGYTVATGTEIRWRKDYVHGIETDLSYFRSIPYLNASLAGDHKVIWELNRHQHLQVLAQAFLLTDRDEFLREISSQLQSWREQNPFMRGINWASALEVAFRAMAWIWIDHLVGDRLGDDHRSLLHGDLYRHGVYLQRNLSIYFSPNTHLLGEAVALHALGSLYPSWPRAGHWKTLGAKIVSEEMDHQVRADGSHFEQSSAYQIYAVDLFLFHTLLEPVTAEYREKLARMADYLSALTSRDGVIPLLGDDDGGSLFFPYGDRRSFSAATLATCSALLEGHSWPHNAADRTVQAAWWLGERTFGAVEAKVQSAPNLFPDAAVGVLANDDAHIVIDAKAFGHGNAGHSHAHALSITCRYQGNDILIDPGTYTYVGEPEWRDRFRGTAFHNTIRIDGRDQAAPSGPFRWNAKPDSQILHWAENTRWCYIHAACSYRGLRHERRAVWIPEGSALAVIDQISETDSEVRRLPTHHIEQFWHCGETVRPGLFPGVFHFASGPAMALTANQARVVEGWQSETPGEKTMRPVICASEQAALPLMFATVLYLQPPGEEPELALDVESDDIVLRAGGLGEIAFPAKGGVIFTRAKF